MRVLRVRIHHSAFFAFCVYCRLWWRDAPGSPLNHHYMLKGLVHPCLPPALTFGRRSRLPTDTRSHVAQSAAHTLTIRHPSSEGESVDCAGPHQAARPSRAVSPSSLQSWLPQGSYGHLGSSIISKSVGSCGHTYSTQYGRAWR